jgi:hypothetical protein
MQKIVCNPINLPYSFQEIDMSGKLRTVCREAADPTLIFFKNKYYLFPSMTGGFFWSEDLYCWNFTKLKDMPIYDYAPDVRQVGEYLYFSASKNNESCTFYRTKDPISSRFEEVSSPFPFWDPHLFQDEDGRVYFYWGCTNTNPIYGVELDRDTMLPLGTPVGLIYGNPEEHGWERTGVNNDPNWFEDQMSEMIAKNYGTAPYIEGAWMTKHDGRYYLQYAAPATERNTYADGVYVGNHPLGSFEYAVYNPISAKPGGFITGAGHGSTMVDAYGNWWHTSTMRISVNHMYERRLGLFPCGFDADGILFCNQNFADYPMVLADSQQDPRDTFAGMMLLSYQKPVTATSSAEGYPTSHITDENIRTRWAADKNDSGEAVTLDLLESMKVEAIQLNFAEHGISFPLRNEELYWKNSYLKRYINTEVGRIRYLLEGSHDFEKWEVLEDKRTAETSLCHDFIVLKEPKSYQYIRLTGYEMPYDGHLSLSGLRVFGKGNGAAPEEASLAAERISQTSAKLSWSKVEGAIGYNIRYGIHSEKLYHSWLVYGQTELILNSLNSGVAYYICIDSFNENGITEGTLLQV